MLALIKIRHIKKIYSFFFFFWSGGQEQKGRDFYAREIADIFTNETLLFVKGTEFKLK